MVGGLSDEISSWVRGCSCVWKSVCARALNCFVMMSDCCAHQTNPVEDMRSVALGAGGLPAEGRASREEGKQEMWQLLTASAVADPNILVMPASEGIKLVKCSYMTEDTKPPMRDASKISPQQCEH